jgi:cation:H+ antiporter
VSLSLLFWFALGLVTLVVGAEILVRGASGLARTLGISALVVGLTVVSFGTSAPELFISVLSLLRGQADLSIGNVVGSNIANILLILGTSALIAPLVVSSQLVRLDVPIMIGASFLVFGLTLDGSLNLWNGACLLVGLCVYITVLIRHERKAANTEQQDATKKASAVRSGPKILLQLSMTVVGLILLIYGAGWLVEAATAIANSMGVSELVIGLTVVAGGTSLPELATSLLAAIRGERDIAIGNVVGSCILNLLLVLGVAGIIAPQAIELNPAVLSFDLPVMIAASIACLPIFFTEHRIARWEGALFLCYYIAYTVYLIVSAQNDMQPIFSYLILGYVLPLTLLTLMVLAARARKLKRDMRG